MSDESDQQAQPQTIDEAAVEAAVEAWKRRRNDKKLQIADECLAAIRLRGMDPAELGITRTRIRSALFALAEADLDEIIERSPVMSDDKTDHGWINGASDWIEQASAYGKEHGWEQLRLTLDPEGALQSLEHMARRASMLATAYGPLSAAAGGAATDLSDALSAITKTEIRVIVYAASVDSKADPS